MEREMNSTDEQLYDLIESRSFDELSSDELSFVLSQTTKEEYIVGYQAIHESHSLNDSMTVRPLILSSKRIAIVVPLYQTLAAIAAAVLISFFVFRSSEIITTQVKVPSLAVADTVYIDNSRYDTVVEKEIHFIDRVIYAKAKGQMVVREHIQSNSNIWVPEINTEDIASVGQSLKNDETYELVKNLIVESESEFFRRD